MEGDTPDTFFNGRLRVRQPADGYRFSIDAILLAHAADPAPGDTVVDLGAGCGIVSLILASRYPQVRIRAVEIQKSLAGIAAANIAENRLEERVRVLRQDMRTLRPAQVDGPARWVVSNPPYRRVGTGRLNPDSPKALARHEISVTLPEVVAAARRLLPLSGRLVLIYPAERLADVLSCMSESGIEPKTLRMVHSAPQSDAVLFLVTGVRGGRPGLRVAPPLAIRNAEGDYSNEVAAMFGP